MYDQSCLHFLITDQGSKSVTQVHEYPSDKAVTMVTSIGLTVKCVLQLTSSTVVMVNLICM